MNNTLLKGFTALELLITVAIAGIVLMFAVPSYQGLLERNRLKQVLESFKDDLQLARTEAFKRQTGVVISRASGGPGAWCYGLAINKASCDCQETNSADADFCDLKRIDGADFGAVTLVAQVVNNNSFDPRRGTVAAGGVTFSSDQYAGRIIFSNTGRVRICTPTGGEMPSGKTGLPSLDDC